MNPSIKITVATGILFVISLCFSSLLTVSMGVKLVVKIERNGRSKNYIGYNLVYCIYV